MDVSEDGGSEAKRHLCEEDVHLRLREAPPYAHAPPVAEGQAGVLVARKPQELTPWQPAFWQEVVGPGEVGGGATQAQVREDDVRLQTRPLPSTAAPVTAAAAPRRETHPAGDVVVLDDGVRLEAAAVADDHGEHPETSIN